MDLELRDSVQKVPLIGPVQSQKLQKLEIRTIEDLLNHYPFRYEDYRSLKKISELLVGQTVTVTGQLQRSQNVYTRTRKNFFKAKLSDETGTIDLVWFNQPYLSQTLKEGTVVNIAGRVDLFSNKLAFVSPEFEILSRNQDAVTDDRPSAGKLSPTIHTGRLVPVYPETAGISSKWLRSRIAFLLSLDPKIDDWLPLEVKKAENLIGLKEALFRIHFPQDVPAIEKAKKRLAFNEVFDLQLRSQVIKEHWQSRTPIFRLPQIETGQGVLPPENLQVKIEQFIKSLPFALTHDQRKVIDEILFDLCQPRPMNRLLQGDVGSGKTVVAAVAAYATALAGYQAVYMAPTEILAHQHCQTFQKLLGPFGTEPILVTSSTGKSHKSKIINPKSGIFIGTHALLYQINQIAKVGLVIIDEQHKFGVQQRGQLLKIEAEYPDQAPHLLTMTATPIPRTLALTVLSDLDLSVIEQLPRQRRPIKTWYVPKVKRAAAYEWIKREVDNLDSQVYVVCPFIEESQVETLKSVRAAKHEFDRLHELFKPRTVALLHGRLKPMEKEKIMANFNAGKIQLLVATPVVEVGLDNPNATIMLIEGTERFGLASLHQLRGRVGRGPKQSYCLLFSEIETPAVINRLKFLQGHRSGLALAELDLKNRGAGSIFGTEQSGFLRTRLADLNDLTLVRKTKDWAQKIVRNVDSQLNPLLKNKIDRLTHSIHLD